MWGGDEKRRKRNKINYSSFRKFSIDLNQVLLSLILFNLSGILVECGHLDEGILVGKSNQVEIEVDGDFEHVVESIEGEVETVVLERNKKERDDLFSSTSKLKDLFANELQIVQLLDTFADYTIEKAKVVKSYVAAQKRLLMSGKDKSDVVGHPVNAYLLVRRTTADFEDTEIALHSIANYSQSVYNWIEAFREGNNFPQMDDLNGAAAALVRLQDTYQLDMLNLAKGNILPPHGNNNNNEIQKKIKGFSSTESLSARDLMFLGKHSFGLGFYDRAIEWLSTAEVAANAEQNSSALISEIQPSLQAAIEVHDDILVRQGPRGVTWRTNDTPYNSALAKGWDQLAKSHKHVFTPKLLQRQSEEEETEHYVRLCRGEELRDKVKEAKLKCHYKFTGSSYLTISPLKIEVQSEDPYIVVIRDFITAKQTDRLIQLGKPKLHASMHQAKSGTGFIKSLVRVSKSAWIKDWEDSSFLTKVTKRVELVTGLKASCDKEAEDYQIANYGLGGLYVPHTDHLMNNPNPDAYTPWERFVGDRIATLMIYLTNVESGGATVFPRAGVSLWPSKGSAAFWWNLDTSGIGDENTRHGACPVLFGDKWVSNKWIRMNEQFLSAPCALHPLLKFKRPS